MDNNCNFERLLTNFLSIDSNTRINAEATFNNLLQTKFEEVMTKLAAIISDESYSEENRQLACLMIKNSIMIKENQLQWFKINNEYIKMNILASLASEKVNIRRSVGNLISIITKLESYVYWPEVKTIDILVEVASTNENRAHIISSIETLGFIIEEFILDYEIYSKNNCDFTLIIIKILECEKLILNKDKNTANLDILYVILKCLYQLICLNRNVTNNQLSFKHFENFYTFYFELSQNLLQNLDTPFKKNLLEEFYKLLIETVDTFYSDIHVIIKYIFKLTHSINTDRRSILLLEFFCNLGDKELQFSYNNKDYKNFNKKYFCEYRNEIFKLGVENLHKINLSTEWSISKASAYILCVLIQVDDSTSLEKLIVYAEDNYFSGDELKRYSSIISLSCCIETIHKEKLANLLKYNFKNFIKTLTDTSEIVSIASSWLSCKITEVYPYIIDKTMLSKYIPLLLSIATKGNDNGFFSKEYTEYDEEPSNEIFRFTKQIQMNMGRVIYNLVKFYGDKTTNKNNSAMSPYLMLTLSDCLVSVFSYTNWEDKNFNISANLFKIINCTIDYSALDFQEHIEIVMQKVIEFYQVTIDDIFSILNTRDVNNLKIFGIVKDSPHNIFRDFGKIKIFLFFLNENICLILVSIYRKILRNVKSELSNKTLYSVMKSFELRNEVYENGFILISQIIICKLIINI